MPETNGLWVYLKLWDQANVNVGQYFIFWTDHKSYSVEI